MRAASGLAVWFSVCLFANASLGQSVTLLLTADNEGRVEPCSDCAEQAQGGLAQRGTLLAERRAADPSLLLIDAGNAFYGPESIASKGAVVADAYEALGYDVVNLSFRDFRLGKAATLELAERAHLPLVSANLIDETTGRPLVEPFVVHEVGSSRIAFLGITEAPAGLTFLPHLKTQLEGVRIRPPADALAVWLSRAEAASDRVALVYYGSRRALQTLRQEFGKRLAVILVGGARGEDLPAGTVPPLVGTSDRGRQVASVRLDLVDNNVSAEQIIVRADLPGDPGLQKVLEKHRASPAPAAATASGTLPMDDLWIPPTVDGRIDLADDRNGGRVMLPGTEELVSCSVNRRDLEDVWQSDEAAPCSLIVGFAEQQQALVDGVVLVPPGDRADGWPTRIQLYASDDGRTWEQLVEKVLPGDPVRATIDLGGRRMRFLRIRADGTVGGDRPRLAAVHVLADPSRSIVAYGRAVGGSMFVGEDNLLQEDAGGKIIGASAGFQDGNAAALTDGIGDAPANISTATQPGTQRTRHRIGGEAGAVADRFVIDQRWVTAERRVSAVLLVDRSEAGRSELIGYYVLGRADRQVVEFEPRRLHELEVSYIPVQPDAVLSVAEIGLIGSEREVAAVRTLPESGSPHDGSSRAVDPRRLQIDQDSPEESLSRTRAEMLELLKSEDYRKLILEYAEPAQVKRLGKETLERVIEQFRQRTGRILSTTLERAKSSRPVFNEDKTKATFSIAGAPGGGLRFQRIDGRWYLVN